MTNGLDEQYIDLLKDILENGVEKDTRNGKVLSVFGRTIRYKFKDGKFPLITTKKMYFKGVVTELLWFLRGDTSIKFLVDNDCHIWDGDAWVNYQRQTLEKFMSDTTIAGYAITNKEEFINKIKTDDEFAKKWGSLGPVYGKQWRSWNGNGSPLTKDYEGNISSYLVKSIDQIANLINELKTNPDSRRLMVSAWNVGELDQMVLPPCHYGFQVYTRELSYDERLELWYQKNQSETGKRGIWEIDYIENYEGHKKLNSYNIPKRAISLMFNMRSNDVPLGLPFNIASYGLLLEIIAKMVNMVPDEIIGNLGDCHIYENQIEGIKEQLTREPYPLPKLNINTEFWQTEGGECGVGPINAQAVLDGFSREDFCKCLMEEDIQLANYESHPAIKILLSN